MCLGTTPEGVLVVCR